MFSHTAQWYDTIYLSIKDYGAEAEKLTGFIRAYGRARGNHLLDVACGTGLHLSYLKAHFHVEGLDLDEKLLAIARQRLLDVPLHHADMTDFDLGRTFAVVTCLFSAIGYVKTLDNLFQLSNVWYVISPLVGCCSLSRGSLRKCGLLVTLVPTSSTNLT